MSIKILIVDDAVFMRNMIKDIFSGDEFEVVGEAANGVEAIEKYKELSPDVVTMDIVMPLKSGIEAVKDIVSDANISDADGMLHPYIVETEKVTTSGAAVTFTGIPSWAKKITLSFLGVSTNTNSTTILIQIGDSGGLETSGYNTHISYLTTAVTISSSTTGWGVL